ncbi:Ig-like domain-containing protein [Ideonella sp. BN130291]|uniref:Ig-like domain-containing protein n=1 Tax=Ideonella sp. BN130291 TaxID=3112940 RepID=UPI002E2531C0|nr:Ig-like domain-containing protein [Ideonella sp. BN130291]
MNVTTRAPWARASRWARALPLSAALALAACGGGLFIGVGEGDEPPSVSLVASASSAGAGQTVRLAAAASDDFGIDHVSFYRVDAGGAWVLLGSDGVGPFEWDAVMPATSAASVQFLARAVDGAGQVTDSDVVSVTVLR